MENQILHALRSALQERGLTIADVARLTGINRANLSLMLSSHKSPTLRTLCRVCAALEVKIEITQKPRKMKKSTTFWCGEYGQFGNIGTKDAFGYICISEKLCEDHEGKPFMRLHWRK